MARRHAAAATLAFVALCVVFAAALAHRAAAREPDDVRCVFLVSYLCVEEATHGVAIGVVGVATRRLAPTALHATVLGVAIVKFAAEAAYFGTGLLTTCGRRTVSSLIGLLAARAFFVVVAFAWVAADGHAAAARIRERPEEGGAARFSAKLPLLALDSLLGRRPSPRPLCRARSCHL